MKKNLNISIGALAAALAIAGCEPSKRSGDTGPPTNVSAREVTKEIKEAANGTKSYVAEGRDQFITSAQNELGTLDQQIAALSAKTESLKDEAKTESNKALAALREQRDQLGKKFEELKSSSKEAWQEVKASFESAFTELEKSYKDAKSKFGG